MSLPHTWWALLPLPFVWRWTPVVLAAYLFASVSFAPPTETVGRGVLHITDVSTTSTRFSHGYRLRGHLNGFGGRRVPVGAYFSSKWERPPCDRDYIVAGELVDGRLLKIDPTVPWEEVEGSWSAAEWRYRLKERVGRYLRKRIGDRRAAEFGVGLVTGNFNEPTLMWDFQRLGLQHLMAISGFHFSLVALLLGAILRPLLSARWAGAALIALLSSYFVFIGYSPSVQRAWVMAVVVLSGWLLGRPCNALNALGLALVIVLLLDPLAVCSIGFQFSFFCTAAILLYYGPIERVLCRWISHFPLHEARRLPLLDQHGYVVISLFRRAVALVLAVHLIALPLTLYHFGKFPLLSLLYNLFFPLLVTVAMLLMPIAAVTGWWWPVEAVLGLSIDITRAVPPALEVVLRFDGIPIWAIATWGTLLLFFAPLVHSRLSNERPSAQLFQERSVSQGRRLARG